MLDRQRNNTPVVGIPRALLYHRYGMLWSEFFDELGVKTVLSPQSNREILERGSAIAIDETCLSNKLYMGHFYSPLQQLRSEGGLLLPF